MSSSRDWLAVLAALVLAAAVSTARAAEDHPAVALVKSKVKDPSKPFALLVPIKVKAGKQQEFEAAFAVCIAATKKEPGCLAYELNRDADDPTAYVMFEKFKNVAALADHLNQDHTKKIFKAMEALADGEIKAKVYLVPE
jgi:quinol monooxygenase YgiN